MGNIISAKLLLAINIYSNLFAVLKQPVCQCFSPKMFLAAINSPKFCALQYVSSTSTLTHRHGNRSKQHWVQYASVATAAFHQWTV